MRLHRYVITCMILIYLFSCNFCQAEERAVFSIKKAILLNYYGSDHIVEVPKKVTIIGKKSFSANKNIKKVTIQKGATTIKSAAFKNCFKLKTIELPMSVKKIAGNAFSGCKRLTIVAPKGSYALKFAKKHKISWKKTKEEATSFYSITGITCYYYTAGTYPCVAEKKIVTDSAQFDRMYEKVLLFNSGEPAEDIDQIAGGKTLCIIIDFFDKESRTIECNSGVYMEDGINNKLGDNVSITDFWDSIESDILKETW